MWNQCSYRVILCTHCRIRFSDNCLIKVKKATVVRKYVDVELQFLSTGYHSTSMDIDNFAVTKKKKCCKLNLDIV